MLRNRVLPTRATSKKITQTTTTPTALSQKRAIIDRSVEKHIKLKTFYEILEARAANGGKKRRGDIKNVVSSYNDTGFKYVTRRSIEWMFEQAKKGALNDNAEKPSVSVVGGGVTLVPKDISDITTEPIPDVNVDTSTEPTTDVETNQDNIETVVNTRKNTGGRKKGTTIEAKAEYLQRKSIAKTEISREYAEQIRVADLTRKGSVPHGTLKNLINVTEIKYSLKQGEIKMWTIRSRVFRKNVDGISVHKQSPLSPLEPDVVQWCIELARMGVPMTKEEVLTLTRELIDGTEMEANLNAFKEKRGIVLSPLGSRWYRGFLKRQSKYVRIKKARIKDKVRSSWCTYPHFSNMYDAAYEAMVRCGVAVKLDKEIMMNKEGVEVHDIKEMYGRPSRYKLVKPENCIYVDETGCNTNMKGEIIGGTNYILPTDDLSAAPVGLVTDLHFTVLCFTCGTGEPVMCAIILKSEKAIEHLPPIWKYGLDERIAIIPGENEFDTFKKNFGETKAIHGGPKCWYKGKHIPCFVSSTSSSSISSELLADMLRAIDSFHVFDRTDGSSPFLLLDGHGSRFMLPFLEYINTPSNKWTVNIGVPYGTHLWQVADSGELNGSFKTSLAKAKLDYIALNKDGVKDKFRPTDIIPLVSMAWETSFARVDCAKKAIQQRGWGPLNYYLLDHPKIQETAPKKISTTTTVNRSGESIMTGNTTSVYTNVNLTGNQTNKLATICIENRLKDSKKNEIYLKQKEEEKGNKKNRESMREWFRHKKNWRSGKFAAANKYDLTDDEVLEGARERTHEADQEKLDAMNRATTRDKNKNENFHTAFVKYSKKKTLTVSDMKALMTKVKVKKPIVDSPFKKKKADLINQWERRKNRLDVYLVQEEVNVDLLEINNNENNSWNYLDVLAEAVENSTTASTNTSTLLARTSNALTGNSNDCIAPGTGDNANVSDGDRISFGESSTVAYGV